MNIHDTAEGVGGRAVAEGPLKLLNRAHQLVCRLLPRNHFLIPERNYRSPSALHPAAGAPDFFRTPFHGYLVVSSLFQEHSQMQL